jgi:flagellar hook assembly protein FlgD
VDEVQTEGFHEVRWNGTNHDGLTVGSGVYFYRLQADGLSENRRMMLLK